MLMMPGNFLLLDEPTNHLDMRAKDVLLTALQEFTGTVLFVSHDRYFIDKLATRVFEVGDGEVRVYPGNYEDYVWRKENAAVPAPPKEAPQPQTVPVPAGNGVSGRDGSSRGPEKRLNPIKLRQMRERQDEIEVEISKLEAEIAGYERALANFISVEETVRQTDLLNARRTDLHALMSEWEDVAQAIEGAR
jgi:ATP-binding cassette subfamily F protein 3